MKIMSTTDGSWEIETLMRKAFQRVRGRFLTYILAYVLMFALVFGVTFLFVFMGILAAGAFANKMTLITGILLAVLTVLGVIAFMYITGFTQLVVVYTLIRKEKGTIMQNINEMKSLVWGYVWLNIAMLIFMIGLLPVGLISIFIVYVLWAFWGSFSAFVYIEHKKKGLDNLWISYMMVKKRFWAIAGRMALVVMAYMLVSGLLSMYDNAILNVLQYAVYIFFGPFILSYDYEIYRLLEVPAKVERPGMWIALSVVGYVFIGLLIFYAGQRIGDTGPRLREFLKENMQENRRNNDSNGFPVYKDGVTLRQLSHA